MIQITKEPVKLNLLTCQVKVWFPTIFRFALSIGDCAVTSGHNFTTLFLR